MTLLATILVQAEIDNPSQFNGYLILGYGVMWLIGLIYLLYLYNRQRNAREDVRVLKKILDEE